MKAIITGSFDPMTIGHIELVRRARAFFDELYVVALLNSEKNYMFTLEEKKEIMRLSLAEFDNIVIDSYDGMTADYMHKNGITKIVRGIRSDNDRRYEENLALQMKNFDSDFETIFIQAGSETSQISSTHARNLIESGESLDGVIASNAIERVVEIFKSKKN